MDELIRAKKKALMLLTDMDRSEKELTDKLKKSGFTPDIIQETLEYVREFGYIDDHRYAVHYLDFYRERRSLLRIRMDLEKKGVSKEIIETAFNELESYDERPMIRKLALKKLRSYSKEDERLNIKVAASLARQGFRQSDIRAVLEELGL